METNICTCCQKPKAALECGLCHDKICKYCAKIMEDQSFSFLAKIPEKLSHGIYCSYCFESNVAAELESYNQTMEQAKEITVYLKNQGKETRLIRRLELPVLVKDCCDYNETLLRLAFFAAQAKYNGLVDVDIISEKIKNGTYQTTKWSGSGVPVQVAAEKLVKDRSTWHYPN